MTVPASIPVETVSTIYLFYTRYVFGKKMELPVMCWIGLFVQRFACLEIIGLFAGGVTLCSKHMWKSFVYQRNIIPDLRQIFV